MSTHQDDEPDTGPDTEPDGIGAAIDDEDLPEDLQPTDDNPLAKPLTDEDDPKSPEELDMLGGKAPEQGESEGEEADSDD